MVLLWDLHDVVFYRDNGSWLKTLFEYKQKYEIIKQISPAVASLLGRFLLHKCHLTSKPVTSEELLIAAQETNNQSLIGLVHLFSQAYKVNQEVADRIEKLGNYGYTHHICSNIGPTFLAGFEERFPQVMKQFSYAHIVEYEKERTLKKPHPDFFISYLAKQNKSPKDVLFIDDSLANVQAAQKLSINAIQFLTPKKLDSDLILHGIRW